MNLRHHLGSARAILAARFRGRHVPLSVTMAVAGRCNYRCAYCSLWTEPVTPLPTDELLGLIDGLARAGMQRIGFSQDEPLLRKDIGCIIDHCKQRGLYVTLGSNGALVPARLAEIRELDVLVLSLDGPREIHDRHREPGAYDRVMDALAAARAAGLTVWITTVLTRFNFRHIPWLLETAARHEVRIAFQLLYHLDHEAGGHPELLPDATDYRAALETVRRARKRGAPVINSPAQIDFLKRWPDYGNPFAEVQSGEPPRLRCWGGRLFLHLEPNGDVYPCSQLVGRPLNALTHGLAPAMTNAAGHVCSSCCLGADYVEYNLLFGLHPGCLWNALRVTR